MHLKACKYANRYQAAKQMTFCLGPMIPLILDSRNFSTNAMEVEVHAAPESCGSYYAISIQLLATGKV